MAGGPTDEFWNVLHNRGSLVTAMLHTKYALGPTLEGLGGRDRRRESAARGKGEERGKAWGPGEKGGSSGGEYQGRVERKGSREEGKKGSHTQQPIEDGNLVYCLKCHGPIVVGQQYEIYDNYRGKNVCVKCAAAKAEKE